MKFTRRDACALGAGTAAVLAMSGWPAWAQEEQEEGELQAAIDEFTGGAEPTEGGLEIDAPEIAENGNTVPIEVSAGDDVEAVRVLATANPNPGICTFHFTELSGDRTAATRIRLAKTQDIVAIARKADGSYGMAKRAIKVTIGGCGG